MNKKKIMYRTLPFLGVAMVLATAGVASAHGFGSGQFGPGVKGDPTVMFKSQADLLGVSVDDVKNAWASGKNIETLAQEKGISKETLHQKMEIQRDTEMKAHLAADVASGKITQAQADTMIADKATHEAERNQTLATALGISVSDLITYQSQGKTIDQIITEKGLNKETVFGALKASHLVQEKAQIQALVTKGVLTQVQADTRIQTMQTNSNEKSGHRGGPGMDGMKGIMGGQFGF